MVEKIEYFECECSSPFHMIRLIRDDKYNEKTMIFHLVNYKTFWGRLKAAAKYLFNFGDIDYDCYMFKPEDKEKFLRWLND